MSYNSQNQMTSVTVPGQTAQTLTYSDRGESDLVSISGNSLVSDLTGVVGWNVQFMPTYWARTPAGQLLQKFASNGMGGFPTAAYETDGNGSVSAVAGGPYTTVVRLGRRVLAARARWPKEGDDPSSPGFEYTRGTEYTEERWILQFYTPGILHSLGPRRLVADSGDYSFLQSGWTRETEPVLSGCPDSVRPAVEGPAYVWSNRCERRFKKMGARVRRERLIAVNCSRQMDMAHGLRGWK